MSEVLATAEFSSVIHNNEVCEEIVKWGNKNGYPLTKAKLYNSLGGAYVGFAPGYFEQEEREKNENTALEDVWNEYPGMTNYEVRAALAACGLTNEHITSKVFVLSGGEAAKVRLCKLMLKNVNWLVLDEPTNHLDVDAKAELKRALIDFKGSVLLVSHEPEFYEDWVTSVWNIEDWTTKII